MKYFTLFPTPYPDELLYSVLCRYHLRSGNPTVRSTHIDLLGGRGAIHPLFTRSIQAIVLKIQRGTGLTLNYFIKATTLFPYYSPLMRKERSDALLSYLQGTVQNRKVSFFDLGIGGQRQPDNMYLRYCSLCVKEDTGAFGEPYWHRTHQLAGVKVCSKHREILVKSNIPHSFAGKTFYPLSEAVEAGNLPIGSFLEDEISRMADLAIDSKWLLDNGLRCGSYENVLKKYDLLFREKGFRGFEGRTRVKRLFHGLIEYYGESFLKLVGAYDDISEKSWVTRIVYYSDSTIHPLYHLLLMRFLAGSAREFFENDCGEALPFGKGPWPCWNKICPHYLQDVIEGFIPHYRKGYCHAEFECPHCGMVYRRKQAMSKEEQYTVRPYFKAYGHLWESKLRKCIFDKGMTLRRTCEALQCDFYTVNKHALKLGLVSEREVTFPKDRAKTEKLEVQGNVGKTTADYQKLWLQLMEDNPTANRSALINMNKECYRWLREHDVTWYEENSPPVNSNIAFWEEKDAEYLTKVKSAVYALLNHEGRPRRVSMNAIIQFSGVHQLKKTDAEKAIPKTIAYLNENIETLMDWQKRKIIWAIGELMKHDELITLNKIQTIASISATEFKKLHNFVVEQIEKD